ncbi:MAG: VOC family protein [Bryobacteraceae bacterium]
MNAGGIRVGLRRPNAAMAGQLMPCGWLTDKFGLCWQIVPEKIGEILKHPKAMAAMMKER